jgi:hypothetical protein
MKMKALTATGRVEEKVIGEGSKSERLAVVLTVPTGESYVLRRHGGPTYGDDTLDVLVGCWLEAEGLEINGTLIMRRWKKLS